MRHAPPKIVRPSGGLRRSSLTLGLLIGLMAVELLVVSLMYQHGFEFECRARAPAWFCGGLSAGVLRAVAAAGAVALLLAARPAASHALAAGKAFDGRFALLHGLGFAVLLAPWFFLTDDSSGRVAAIAFVCWLAGLTMAAIGAALALAPTAAWRAAARALGAIAIPILTLAVLAPEIAAAAQWLWKWPFIADVTFMASASVLGLTGQSVVAIPETYELGINKYSVLVGRQCSGVEGFALITGFLTGYIWLFKDRLNVRRALILLPIGILASWCLNVVRISVLVSIGAMISPELAINGFHSHAGWLMFTLLSVGLAMAAHTVPWLRADKSGTTEALAAAPRSADASATRLPFFQDPIVAQILPFAVFMASALLASTFVQTPAVVYPLRALAMAAVLALLWRPILAMDWRIHWTALAVGVLVGVAWILTAPGPGDSDQALAAAVADLAGPAFVLWVAARLIGTTLLVPLIEEMFFRGYVLDRLNIGHGWVGLVLALAVSTALFALLHDRWAAAALAGLIFAGLALRRGRLTDAIAAHAVANGVIALQAVIAGEWHVI